jgi:hypothetical protein
MVDNNMTLTSHWDKLFIYNDLLTVTSPEGIVGISPINAALLNDTNWYAMVATNLSDTI